MSKQQVTTRCGQVFEVDTSDEACGKFGFKHGDRIIMGDELKGIVIGVAPATQGSRPEPEVLWYSLERDDGKVSYSYPFQTGRIRLA